MKEVTSRWLNAWKKVLSVIGIILLGIPTFGFAWIYLEHSLSWRQWEKDRTWKLTAVETMEVWLHFWRGVLLFFAGFPTLGYAWFLMAHLEEPYFTGPRNKYRGPEVKHA